MDRNSQIRHNAALRFAELVASDGRRLHVGCVMAVGQDWVEVSLPKHFRIEGDVRVRFPPSLHAHNVRPQWRSIDRAGFTYLSGGPPEEQFAGLSGLFDPRPASLMLRRGSGSVLAPAS